MELWRRIIFYGCFTIGILLFMYAQMSPAVYIETFNPDEERKSFVRKYIDSLLSKEERREIEEKKLREIASKTIKVEHESEWKEIYLNLRILQEQKSFSPKNWKIPNNWKRRLPDEKYPSKVFFFLPNESPVNKLSSYFNKNNDRLYLYLPNLNAYLKAHYKIYSKEDFHLGSGFSNLPRPPNWILYPYRNYAIFLFIFGILSYIFLPYKTISKDALRYPRWKVIAGDFAVFILVAVFFSLPLFIAGGTLQAFTIGAPITVVMWLISLLVFYSIKIAAWYASYQILPLDEGIKIATYKGVGQIRYDEMEYFQPVIFKPPKWLVILSWLAALSGRGSTGRAILLSSSQTGTIGIRLKNGRDLFIVVTDQMGREALKGFERIIESLRSFGVKELDEVREIRSMGFEVMR